MNISFFPALIATYGDVNAAIDRLLNSRPPGQQSWKVGDFDGQELEMIKENLPGPKENIFLIDFLKKRFFCAEKKVFTQIFSVFYLWFLSDRAVFRKKKASH